jgi:hypothetical protein
LAFTAEALSRREIIIDNKYSASLRLRGLKGNGTFDTNSRVQGSLIDGKDNNSAFF